MSENQSKKITVVKCPTCKAEVEWTEAETERPFCSKSCKDKDFLGWANEDHHIPGSPAYDDILSGDLDEGY